MPAIIINKDMILQAAFEIVRSEGFSSISARRIASYLNCSTKPIYREFINMEELEKELMEKISAYALDNILHYDETEHVYFNIGLGFLHFAEHEKELYKILFLSDKNVMDFLNEKYMLSPEAHIKQMKKDPKLHGFSDAQLKHIFIHMFIFTHGISSMLACNALSAPQAQIRDMINTAFSAYTEYLRHSP